MRRTLIALLITSACGGSHKSTTPPPPLPEDKKSEPTPVAEAPKPAPPPKDPDPIDVPLAMGKATYKLASAGKGTKAVIKIAGEKGLKQQVVLAIDFAGKQTAPPELGGSSDDVAPTLVLASDLEVGDADNDGAKFKVTFTGIDARDRPGMKKSKDEFKTALAVLVGVQLTGSVARGGQLSNVSLHVDKPNDNVMGALELIRISIMPMWPILPAEAIGVGAKWTVSTTYTIADRLETTQTTDYEVLSHKGAEWKLKGTTKLVGKDQTIKDAKFEKIGGAGGVEFTITDGAFMPVSASKLVNDFTATVGDAGKPASVQFHLEQGLAVTPAGATPATPPATPATKPAPAAKTPAAPPAAKAPAPATTTPAPPPAK